MIDIVLLVLKIASLVLLYLFIWQVARSAVGNVRAAGAPAAPPAARASASRASLRGQQGEWELREAVTVIGRSRRCDIVLTDPNVSRQHAEIRRQDDGFMALDLGSTNGMRVNRRDVKQAVLQHGDRIELGTAELVFERLP